MSNGELVAKYVLTLLMSVVIIFIFGHDLVVKFIISFLPNPQAQSSIVEQGPKTLAPSEIYDHAKRSVVVVLNLDAKGEVHATGSGVVFTDHQVVTNCHVLKNAAGIKVRSEAQEHVATFQFADWERDVCSLYVSSLPAPAAVLGATGALAIGARVYAIGAPKGLELTLSDGLISGVRQFSAGKYIQTTAAISPGSSGGGLFDQTGALIGLTTFHVIDGQNLNFAVPIEWVRELPIHGAKVPPPGTVIPWLDIAIHLETQKNWRELLVHCFAWTKEDPRNPISWFGLGTAYSAERRYAEAIEAFRHVLLLNPGSADAWQALAIAYANAGQWDNAAEARQQALMYAMPPQGTHASSTPQQDEPAESPAQQEGSEPAGQ